MKDVYEYKVIDRNGFLSRKYLEEELNVLGSQGWRLVCIAKGWLYLERKY